MRSFAGLDALIGLVPAQVVTSLSAIDFGRGSEAFYRDQMPGLLTELADRARVLSITASSAIEGVIVADADRAKRIIDRRTTTLRNRSEQELAGYRDAQDYLFREDWRVISCNFQCLPVTTRPGTRQATCSARTGFRDHAGQPGRRPMSLRDHAGPPRAESVIMGVSLIAELRRGGWRAALFRDQARRVIRDDRTDDRAPNLRHQGEAMITDIRGAGIIGAILSEPGPGMITGDRRGAQVARAGLAVRSETP